MCIRDRLKADMERKEVLAGRQKNFFADRESLAERLSGLDKEVYRLSAQQEKLEESVEAQDVYKRQMYACGEPRFVFLLLACTALNFLIGKNMKVDIDSPLSLIHI